MNHLKLMCLSAQVGKPNKLLNKDKKQLAFAPSSLILANNFLPVNRALGEPQFRAKDLNESRRTYF